ncbi:MAG: prephenate dehydrogenase/arogenate dehydrogenase family protein [Oceanicoccus sp.]|uniref:prephenate dehydrogenase/arogenate dehydrogenase family protein n=1 Tax=Oceanicoccus sp. TaxID=2691044 RepID=UPI00261B6584|nr:prephenate dehydrogenase/arogenate dehydrogenase family protein [Oceanicoccus sp.]MDG1772502.1 prephenate dehydrogenase/arogenate dehydrogenase family protein [Oceanicoccus sp.]
MTIAINQITVLAVGLIGGSLAKALKANGFSGEIVGWGRREVSLKKGLELGVIDRYSLDLKEAVTGADLIVVATPTLIAADMLKQLASIVDEQVIITDVASVKGNLFTAAKEAFGKVPPNLVLGHPIAGSEKSGVDAARADLFVNHRVILTPTEETNPDALQAVKSLWESTGADLVEMSVDEHDEVLAATSHLPHVLAYTLVDALAGSPEQQNIFRFAAGGFRDFTRIASSDPTMWHEISLANRDALLKMIDRFTDQLGDLRQAIANGDSDNIVGSFTRAKSARDKFAQMLEEQQK